MVNMLTDCRVGGEQVMRIEKQWLSAANALKVTSTKINMWQTTRIKLVRANQMIMSNSQTSQDKNELTFKFRNQISQIKKGQKTKSLHERRRRSSKLGSGEGTLRFCCPLRQSQQCAWISMPGPQTRCSAHQNESFAPKQAPALLMIWIN